MLYSVRQSIPFPSKAENLQHLLPDTSRSRTDFLKHTVLLICLQNGLLFLDGTHVDTERVKITTWFSLQIHMNWIVGAKFNWIIKCYVNWWLTDRSVGWTTYKYIYIYISAFLLSKVWNWARPLKNSYQVTTTVNKYHPNTFSQNLVIYEISIK